MNQDAASVVDSFWEIIGQPSIYREHADKAASFDAMYDIIDGAYWERIGYDPHGFEY